MIVAECPAIPGCVSQGRTEPEALKNIREAIAGCIEARAANGMPLHEVEVVAVEIDQATKSLADCASAARREPLVVLDHGKPIAVLLPLENTDLETASLSSNPRFLKLSLGAEPCPCGRSRPSW
ncbi:MAG: hypothetical protein HYR60_10855 [Acidobacteria bacterium]|nr:hypothetical protein [Acidobacteriota bacterium]